MKKQKKEQTQPEIQKPQAARAKVKYLRIAPRKVRGVINAIRYKHPEKAFTILATINKKAARMVEKILKTAVANAKVLGLNEARLYISEVRADGGPVMKRFMERSMGRGNRILKRTTHLSMIVTEGNRTFTIDQDVAAREESKESGSGKSGKIFKSKKKVAAKA